MTNESILYLQTNNDIAVEVKKLFEQDDCEFLVTDSAEATFEMMRTREFSLVLVDSYVPDMRLIEFVSKCNSEYPGVLLNVCTDLRDNGLVVQLMSIGNVKKIFLPPWDIADMEDGIRATLDEVQIQKDLNIRSDDLQMREDDFNVKIEELTHAMKMQQHSYSKLSAILNPMRDAFIRISNAEILSEEDLFCEGDNASKEKKDRDRYITFISQASEKFLRLQTTGKMDSDRLEEQLLEDLKKTIKNAPDITINETDLVFVQKIPRNNLSVMWFALWLAIRLQVIMCKKGIIDITSRYITSTRLKVSLEVNGVFTTSQKAGKYLEFVEEIMKLLTQQSEVTKTDNSMIYDMYFLL